MSLSVGIVGLPNAGKSTLFNALASRRLAETAPRPFTTIDPNEAVVAVPDSNLEKLAKIVSTSEESNVSRRSTLPPSEMSRKPEVVPATVTFIDIAGLIKGAHKGEGLGNQFLAKIREVNALVHVVRAFSDPNVSHQHAGHEPGSLKQILEDIEIVNLELELGGIEKKPTIYVLNTDEESLQSTVNSLQKNVQAVVGSQSAVVYLCAKLEEELIDLSEEERGEYLRQLGVKQSGLEKLIRRAYKLLNLITFYTIRGPASVESNSTTARQGQRIISAFSLVKGKSALEAAEKVHTDFAKKFIKAEVILVDRLLEIGDWKGAKEKGKVRLEGKDYVVQHGDVVEFKIGA